MKEEKNNRLLTTEELSERWGIAIPTLMAWRSQNKGPKYLKLGDFKTSRVRYRMEDIIEYEASFLVKTAN